MTTLIVLDHLAGVAYGPFTADDAIGFVYDQVANHEGFVDEFSYWELKAGS